MKRASVRKFSADPKIRPINKTTISDEIVEQIMGLIERGDLQPGQRLPSERELCVRFGTGRSSLREALRCLSIVGVLRARVGEGTSVANDSGKFLGKIMQWRMVTERHDIENLMEVRIALEGLSASSVAANGKEEDIAQLDELIDRMKAAEDDTKKYSALDLEFHLALAKASGNPLVLDLITLIRHQLMKGLHRVLATPNARPLSTAEHIRIMQEIRKHNPEGAQKAMYVHLHGAIERYRNRLKEDAQEDTDAAPPPGMRGRKPKAATKTAKRTRSRS